MTEQPYGNPAYYPNPQGLAPLAPRPPLTAQQKRGAMWAGGVGFTLMTVGFSLVALVVTVVMFAAFFAAILRMVGTQDRQANEMLQIGLDVSATYWWIPVVIAVIGVGLWLLGYFMSVRILKSSGNPRAHAITWASLGIAIVATWMIGSVISMISGVLIQLPKDETSGLALLIGGGIFGLLVNLAVTVAIGVFTWWWMAHAMRDRAAAHPAV